MEEASILNVEFPSIKISLFTFCLILSQNSIWVTYAYFIFGMDHTLCFFSDAVPPHLQNDKCTIEFKSIIRLPNAAFVARPGCS